MPGVKSVLTGRNIKHALDVIASIAMILAAGFVSWEHFHQSAPRGRTLPLPAEPLAIESASVKGDARAPVAMLEFSEFQCPYCGEFARNVLPELERAYVATGKLRIAFRHLPLEARHPDARPAAEAVECAGAQGLFWKMHDVLFRNQQALSGRDLRRHAEQIGVQLPAFDSCLAAANSRVEEDKRLAGALGVTGTPTFFIGVIGSDGRLRVMESITGAEPVDRFKRAIDTALGAAPRP